MLRILTDRRNIIVLTGIVTLFISLLIAILLYSTRGGHWETVSVWTGKDTVEESVWVRNGSKVVIVHGIAGDIVTVVPES